MTPARERLLAAVVARLPERGRIAVDGIDGAGKTRFADELAEVLRRNRSVVRVRSDDFLHPPRIRHRRGRCSPEGYWADSFDYDRLLAALPDEPTTTIVDGVFLQRPELTGVWNCVIFLETTFERAAGRMAVRDGTPADPEHPRMRRYTDAQRRYLAEFRPRDRADLVIDNDDIENPVMARGDELA